jgi:hypothetical protein
MQDGLVRRFSFAGGGKGRAVEREWPGRCQWDERSEVMKCGNTLRLYARANSVFLDMVFLDSGLWVG